jgi:hypothetical protein
MSRGAHDIYGYLRLPCRIEVNARIAGQPPAAIPVLEKRLG